MMGLDSFTNSFRKEFSMVILTASREKVEWSTSYQCTLSVEVASKVKSMVAFLTLIFEALKGMK